MTDESLADAMNVAMFVAAAAVTYSLVRLMLPVVARAAKRSKWQWDDIIADRKLRNRVSLLGPAVVVYVGARLTTSGSDAWTETWRRSTASVVIALVAATISALLHACNTVYEQKPIARDRPIEAYIQVAQIIVYLFGAVTVIAVLAGQSPWYFVSGLGAITAILLLVFRDTILSFVASVQIVQADMLDEGDWIELPEYGADGHVTDIALHTVTVKNFDNTISRIPTYQLVNRSFKNWRGMARSGRRRIKRKIHIDLETIRFLSDDEIERFARFEPLHDYMASKLAELAVDRSSRQVPEGFTDDPRRLTNVGTLRAYIVSYLERQQAVDTDTATFLVRQLEPGPTGLPIEIYSFATTTDWVEYERLQADIFDHLLAMIPEFGLRVFQEPSGSDVRGADVAGIQVES